MESAAADAAADAAPAADRSLAGRARKIEAGTHGDACEEQLRRQRRTVAEAIDRMWPAIQARGASLADAPPYTRARLGPTYVRNRAPPAPPARGWTSRDRSWGALAAELAALGPDVDERWVSLAREAHALLVFDFARVVAGAWRDTPHTALEPQRVDANKAVARGADALVVPLDAGAFDAVKADLARIVEGAWTSAGLHVRVRWTAQASEPTAYKFVLGEDAGEPSYVSEKYREIVLNPDVRAHAIAHEVGHVLGFADRYAKRWDAARCVYVDEQEPGDIMSEPDGPVTAEEWSLLAAAYPK